MLSPASNLLASQIQDALASGDFDRADPLLTAFAASTRAQWEASASSAERQAIAEACLDRLSGWLHLSRVLRAHVASHLRAANAESSYCNHPGSGPTFRLQG